MEQAALEGQVAIVVVDVEASSAFARELGELATSLRGTVIQQGPSEQVLAFTATPRAAKFCLELHDTLRHGHPGPLARVGLHVGEIVHRDGEILGASVRVARQLADRAADGQTLVSHIVRDLLQQDSGLRIVRLSPPATGVVWAFDAFALTRAPDTPQLPRASTSVSASALESLRQVISAARLTLVLGRAGSGKTTLLGALADVVPTIWIPVPEEGMSPAGLAREIIDGLRLRVPGLPATLHQLVGGLIADDETRSRAETLAAFLAETLDDHLTRDLVVVVDGVDRLEVTTAGPALLEALARHAPREVHLVLTGRRDPGLRTDRLRTTGGLAVVQESDLRLDDDAITAIAEWRLDRSLGPHEKEWLLPLADGHPETAVLAAAHLSREDATLPGTAAGIAQTLLNSRDPADRILLETVAALGVASTALLERMTGVGLEHVLASLTMDGLLRPVGGSVDLVEVGAAVRALVRVDPAAGHDIRLQAAHSLEEAGDAAGALRMLGILTDTGPAVAVVQKHGRGLLAEGEWTTVLDSLGAPALNPTSGLANQASSEGGDGGHALAGTLGEAWRLAGDRERALAWFDRATSGTGPIPAWLAWRVGTLLHFGGEVDQARSLYARAATNGDPVDLTLIQAWSAAAAWIQGDMDACREHAGRAEALGREHPDDQSLAAVHTVLAMLAAVDGDRAANDRHYLRALEHAERAGDLLQIIRIRTNRGSRLLEEGDHVEALAELEVALQTADITGAKPVHAMALLNRGQVLRRLGRLDEATADLVTSRDVFELAGSRWIGYALANLGELYAVRGERALAMAAFEEALTHCAPVNDVQGMVPALTGLAYLVLPHDPDRARELANRATRHPESLAHSHALAALALVAHEQGDDETAARSNREGLRTSRRRRDLPGMARHLELRGAITQEAGEARASLIEARSLWERMGCPLETARVDVELARRDGSRKSFAVADEARHLLRAHGARAWADEADRILKSLLDRGTEGLHAHVLGQFALSHDGVALSADELPDDDGRALLAYLLVQRRRAGTLEDAASAVSSGDPSLLERFRRAEENLTEFLRRHATSGTPGEIRGDDLAGLLPTSDLDEFLSEVEAGMAALRHGHDDDAERHLVIAEAAYQGQLLDGWSAHPWVTAARDDAVEAYLQAVMALVELAEKRGDAHGSVRLLLRILERDPYDEAAHLHLVTCLERSGRRGESRRRYRAYTARMQEIGVEPAPFPDLTATN